MDVFMQETDLFVLERTTRVNERGQGCRSLKRAINVRGCRVIRKRP